MKGYRVLIALTFLAGMLCGVFFTRHSTVLSEMRNVVRSMTTPERHLAGGVSATLLKQLIQKDYPWLENKEANDWGKVKALRQWAYEHVDWSTKSALIDTKPGFQYAGKDAPELFSLFFKDWGGVWCGGAAFSLMKLYHTYGFEAYTVDSGKRGMMTHVMTLVKIDYEGREIFAIQDPSFNVCYVDSEEKPYGYFDFLKTLKNRNHDNIVAQQGTNGHPDFLVHPDDDIGMYAHMLDFQDEPRARLPDGRLKYGSGLTFESFWKKFGPPITKFLESKGLPPNSVYLFLYPISIHDGDKSKKEMLSRAKSIVAHSFPTDGAAAKTGTP